MRSRGRPLIVVLVALLLISGIRWALTPGPDHPRARGADLVAWDLTGCWEIEAEPWRQGLPDPRRGDGETAREEAAGDPALPPLPRLVMLVADSIDPSRRSSTTYRAAPLDGAGAALRDQLRWFVRADTLWIIWSDSVARAGMALTPDGQRFQGGARVLMGETDLSARAAAWKVNCATRLTDRPRVGPRR